MIINRYFSMQPFLILSNIFVGHSLCPDKEIQIHVEESKTRLPHSVDKCSDSKR